jgi:hypothetical protein
MKTLLFGLSLSALAQDAPEEVPAAEANQNTAIATDEVKGAETERGLSEKTEEVASDAQEDVSFESIEDAQ